MMRVDPRRGSGEFVRLLRRAGVPVRKVWMRFADFRFWGHGPHGRCRVGVERKTIAEIVGEVSGNRFIGHQLPGLLGMRKDGQRRYDYLFIVIEGDRYIDPRSGLLNPKALKFLPRRAHIYRTVQKFELTLMLKGGVRVIYTKNKLHTTEFLAALYEWFQVPWNKHKSVYKVEESAPDAAILADRTLKRKVANQLVGLAWTRSLKADKYFPSIVDMVTATPQQWAAALGFKSVGKIPTAIADVCHQRDDVKAKGR